MFATGTRKSSLVPFAVPCSVSLFLVPCLIARSCVVTATHFFGASPLEPVATFTRTTQNMDVGLELNRLSKYGDNKNLQPLIVIFSDKSEQ